MRLSRRSFLGGSADVVKRALGAATKAGASYADVRLVHRRREELSTREDRIEDVGMLARCNGLFADVLTEGMRVPALRTHELNLASISEAV